jgi:hypothetical protein
MRSTLCGKFKASTALERSCLSLVLLLLLVSASQASANTGTVHLSSAYNYRSVTYNTYVKWAGDLYGDRLNYGLGSDSHINFTNFSMGSPSNPSWTFGVVSQGGNVTISAIQENYVRLSAATTSPGALTVTFYYASLPAEVVIAAPANTSISSSSYYTTYSAWAASAAPAIYNNAGSDYLMIRSTYSTPVIQILQMTATTSSSTSTSASASTSSSKSTTTTSTTSTSSCQTSSASSPSVSATNNFVMTISPSSGVVVQGVGISAQVEVSSLGSTVGTVFVSVINPIPGASVTVVPVSGTPYFSSQLSIVTSRSTQAGSYCIQVTGSEGGISKTSTYALKVSPASNNATDEPTIGSLFSQVVAAAAVTT